MAQAERGGRRGAGAGPPGALSREVRAGAAVKKWRRWRPAYNKQLQKIVGWLLVERSPNATCTESLLALDRTLGKR